MQSYLVKKFTIQVLNKFRPKTIFTSHELTGNILANKENDYNLALRNLPKVYFFMWEPLK